MPLPGVQPRIDIIIGPMFSGKSTETIRRLIIYYEMDMKVLYVNHSIDNRSEWNFSTHNKTIGELPFENVKTNDLNNIDVKKYDVIAIDEAQFFENLKTKVLEWVEKMDKIVLVAGLNGDYKREEFGDINKLIPLSDSITKLSPFCILCKNNKGEIKEGNFTKKIIKNDSKVFIGGKESYIPVCRKCYLLN